MEEEEELEERKWLKRVRGGAEEEREKKRGRGQGRWGGIL